MKLMYISKGVWKKKDFVNLELSLIYLMIDFATVYTSFSEELNELSSERWENVISADKLWR